MKNKKSGYAKMSVAKKIKMTVMLAFVGLATIFFITNITLLLLMARISNEDASAIHATVTAFVVISFLISSIFSFVVIRTVIKILHKNIGKPVIEFLFGAKKSNEGLEELGIKMTDDTEDEIALISSVYFKIAEQLKIHAVDVRKLSGLTEKFENSANIDGLTGILNRRRFGELVQSRVIAAAMKNEPTFVFMLDLDFFKKVNDTYGHAAGDEVLKVMASRVSDTVRPYDLFGRYGGEEFILFIAVSDLENALGFAERIRSVIQAAPVHFEGVDIPVTASIGVAQSAPDVDYEDAVKHSDVALYKAKENGRNRVEFFVDDGTIKKEVKKDDKPKRRRIR